MHSSDVSEVQFVPVGMDDTVEEVRQRVAELPSFAGRVFTLHAEGVLLETGPFSATGIEDGGAVQVQTAHFDKKTTLEKQFLDARKALRKKEPNTTHVVQQLSLLERRWVASKRTQNKTRMVHFIAKRVEYLDDSDDEEDDIDPWSLRWADVSKKDKKLAAAGPGLLATEVACETHQMCPVVSHA